jgi:hypothetical protein
MTPVPSPEARRAIPPGFLFAVLQFITTVHADPIASSDIYVIDGDTSMFVAIAICHCPQVPAPGQTNWAGRGGICFR